jgi:preprotein translocase subunit YajC
MRKKQKKAQEMLAKLEKNDEVITSGGLFGRIRGFDEKRGTVSLEIAPNVQVRVLRGAVSGLAEDPDATPKTTAS